MMTMHTAKRLPRTAAALVAWGVTMGVVASAGRADEGSSVVYCYDPGRDTVSEVVAGKCAGEVISADKAAEIRARRAQRIQRALMAKPTPVIPGRKQTGLGSAFFISRDGKVVTNNHVIDECAAVSVQTTTGKQAPAKVLAVDKAHDLAVLQADMKAPATAAFHPPLQMEAGKKLFIIGYPTKTLPPLRPQLTLGTYVPHDDTIMASLTASDAVVSMRAFVYPGNSGGPVLDDGGRVVGVVVAKINSVSVFKKTGTLVRDLGFAISLPVVFRFLDRHRIAYQTATPEVSMSDEELFGAAKPFIARIGCWN